MNRTWEFGYLLPHVGFGEPIENAAASARARCHLDPKVLILRVWGKRNRPQPCSFLGDLRWLAGRQRSVQGFEKGRGDARRPSSPRPAGSPDPPAIASLGTGPLGFRSDP